MNEISGNIRNPQFWWALIMVSAGLMMVGWAKTYPIQSSQQVRPVMSVISPLFWIGLCLGFLGLAGFSLSSDTRIGQWLGSILFVIFLSTPHFLYIAWGSDAGSLANMSAYARLMGSFNYERDLATVSYYQWPLSIFFTQFLADLFNVNVYIAAGLNFVLTCIAIGSSLFLLWHRGLANGRTTHNAVFWGVVVYFAGFFWLFNWQASPYDFALILFFPAIALLERNNWRERLLLFLLVVTGFESHALVGVWLSMIILFYLAIGLLVKKHRKRISLTMASIVMIAQATVIIYKNNRFFRYLALNLEGYYDALLRTGGSGKAFAIQASGALNSPPLDNLGIVLKRLSFIDLGFIGTAMLASVILLVLRKRLAIPEISLSLAGASYFLIGIQFAALGTRSFQLIALAPSFFVVDSIAQNGKVGRLVLAASVIGLLLFPAAIMRSHQNSGNYVKPADLIFADFINQFKTEVIDKDYMIFSEGIRPVDLQLNSRLISPNTIVTSRSCSDRFLMVDSPHLREFSSIYQQTEGGLDIDTYIDLFLPTTIYDNGALSLRVNGDCASLNQFFTSGIDH